MNYKTKLSTIKLFAFDYDGVFTNGTVYLICLLYTSPSPRD